MNYTCLKSGQWFICNLEDVYELTSYYSHFLNIRNVIKILNIFLTDEKNEELLKDNLVILSLSKGNELKLCLKLQRLLTLINSFYYSLNNG